MNVVGKLLIMEPWELHPAIVHFPLAFLFGGVVMDLVALRTRKEGHTRAASGLYIGGILSALPAIATGIIAWFTVPHSDEVHILMFWHPGLAIFSVLLFAFSTWLRWRERWRPPRAPQIALILLASMALAAAGYVGGYLVYNGGVGIVGPEEKRPVENGDERTPATRPPSAEDVLEEKQQQKR